MPRCVMEVTVSMPRCVMEVTVSMPRCVMEATVSMPRCALVLKYTVRSVYPRFTIMSFCH